MATDKDIERLKMWINNRSLVGLIEDTNKLPDRMRRGLSLVYPERQTAFLDDLLEKTKNGQGLFVEDALQVIQALEDGYSVEDADRLIKDKGNFYKQRVRSYVLTWSKRGPEFFKKTLPIPFSKLQPDIIRDINKIEQENLIYAKSVKKYRTHKKKTRGI